MDMKQWFQTHRVYCPGRDRYRVRAVIAAHYPYEDLQYLADHWDERYQYVAPGSKTFCLSSAVPPSYVTCVSVDEFVVLFSNPDDDISELPDILEII